MWAEHTTVPRGLARHLGAVALALAVAACGSTEKPKPPPPPPAIQGIGALLRVVRLPDGRDLTVVDRVVVEGPAAKAGVLENEAIWTIDGADAAGLELMEVVRRIKGPEGSAVTLGLGGDGGPARTVEVVRGPADATRIECLEGVCQTGRGVRVDAFGDLYEGDFVDGKFQGKGKLTTRYGRVYTGDFVDGVAHGQGVLATADGVVITGTFQYGNANGPGRIVSPNGDVYEGQVVNQRMHGEGKLTRPTNGDTWTGTYAEDRLITGTWVHHPQTDKRRCTRKVDGGRLAEAGVIDYDPADPAGRVRFEGPFGDDCVANGKGAMTYKKRKKPVVGTFAGDALVD